LHLLINNKLLSFLLCDLSGECYLNGARPGEPDYRIDSLSEEYVFKCQNVAESDQSEIYRNSFLIFQSFRNNDIIYSRFDHKNVFIIINF